MILNKIVADKKEELSETKSRVPLRDVKAMANDARPVRDFAASLLQPGRVSVIAEVKKASPSKGVIRADFDPVEVAKVYEQNGAAAISVLTESRHFMGALGYLQEICRRVDIPVLRKDFIFDDYQVYESRAGGADAFLLIASILDKGQMSDLYQLGKGLGMEALAEAHDEKDLEKILDAGFFVVGINNRDLSTFKVDIAATGRLINEIPYDRVVVSESGISTSDDMRYLRKTGADAALIGEALMREKDFGKKLKELAEA